jgi:hypothetical protein
MQHLLERSQIQLPLMLGCVETHLCKDARFFYGQCFVTALPKQISFSFFYVLAFEVFFSLSFFWEN